MQCPMSKTGQMVMKAHIDLWVFCIGNGTGLNQSESYPFLVPYMCLII